MSCVHGRPLIRKIKDFGCWNFNALRNLKSGYRNTFYQLSNVIMILRFLCYGTAVASDGHLYVLPHTVLLIFHTNLNM